MASLTSSHGPVRVRWIATALLHALLHSDPKPPPKARRHYPPQRDRAIESAAMAREMYRL